MYDHNSPKIRYIPACGTTVARPVWVVRQLEHANWRRDGPLDLVGDLKARSAGRSNWCTGQRAPQNRWHRDIYDAAVVHLVKKHSD